MTQTRNAELPLSKTFNPNCSTTFPCIYIKKKQTHNVYPVSYLSDYSITLPVRLFQLSSTREDKVIDSKGVGQATPSMVVNIGNGKEQRLKLNQLYSNTATMQNPIHLGKRDQNAQSLNLALRHFFITREQY